MGVEIPLSKTRHFQDARSSRAANLRHPSKVESRTDLVSSGSHHPAQELQAQDQRVQPGLKEPEATIHEDESSRGVLPIYELF
jgi:hypothetical protein